MDLDYSTFSDETTSETTSTNRSKEQFISIEKMLEWFEYAPVELALLREMVIRDLVMTLTSNESEEYEVLVKWEPIIANECEMELGDDNEIRIKPAELYAQQDEYNEIREAVVRNFAVANANEQSKENDLKTELENEIDGIRIKTERIDEQQAQYELEYIGDRNDYDSQDDDYGHPIANLTSSNNSTHTSSIHDSIESEIRPKSKPKFQIKFSIMGKNTTKKRIPNRPKEQKICKITAKLQEIQHHEKFDDANKINLSAEKLQHISTACRIGHSQNELEDKRLTKLIANNIGRNLAQSEKQKADIDVDASKIGSSSSTLANRSTPEENGSIITGASIETSTVNNLVNIPSIEKLTPAVTSIQSAQTSEDHQLSSQQSHYIPNINYRRTIINRWLNQQQCENANDLNSTLNHYNQPANSSVFSKKNYNGRRTFKKMSNCSVVVNSVFAKHAKPSTRNYPQSSGVIINPLLINSSSSRLPSGNISKFPSVVINPKLMSDPNMIADLQRNQTRARPSFAFGNPVIINPRFLK